MVDRRNFLHRAASVSVRENGSTQDGSLREGTNPRAIIVFRHGRMFAAIDRMHRHAHRPMTAQSGALPEIRLEGESVVFYLDIATASGASRLVLRCDPDGNVWACIRGALAGQSRQDAA